MANNWIYVGREGMSSDFRTKSYEKIIMFDPAYTDESRCEKGFAAYRLAYTQAYASEKVYNMSPEAGNAKVWLLQAKDSNYSPPMRWVETKVDGVDDLVAAPFETVEELHKANYDSDSFPHAKMVWIYNSGLTIYATLLYHDEDSSTAATFENDLNELLMKMEKAFGKNK